jgi:hypothetical protein
MTAACIRKALALRCMVSDQKADERYVSLDQFSGAR